MRDKVTCRKSTGGRVSFLRYMESLSNSVAEDEKALQKAEEELKEEQEWVDKRQKAFEDAEQALEKAKRAFEGAAEDLQMAKYDSDVDQVKEKVKRLKRNFEESRQELNFHLAPM